MYWAGRYAAATKPDVIIHLGDHWDMPSLSSYDVGKKSFEGRRYVNDIEAGNMAMEAFMHPIRTEQRRLREGKRRTWKPRMVFLLGNHEYRIERAIESDAKLDGLMSYNDFFLDNWEVVPFLEPIIIDGIAYKFMSCIMGHVQDRDIAYARKADGNSITGLFAGIFYTHSEDYLNPQTNGSWSGIWMLNEVNNGSFDELPISINYLRRKYG
jgi:hypothetical protein